MNYIVFDYQNFAFKFFFQGGFRIVFSTQWSHQLNILAVFLFFHVLMHAKGSRSDEFILNQMFYRFKNNVFLPYYWNRIFFILFIVLNFIRLLVFKILLWRKKSTTLKKLCHTLLLLRKIFVYLHGKNNSCSMINWIFGFSNWFWYVNFTST